MDALTGRHERLGQIVDDHIECHFTCTPFEYLGRNGVGLKDTFWRKQNPAALCFVVRQPNTVRQPRTRIVRDLGHRRGHLFSPRTKAPSGMCFGPTQTASTPAPTAHSPPPLNSPS